MSIIFPGLVPLLKSNSAPAPAASEPCDCGHKDCAVFGIAKSADGERAAICPTCWQRHKMHAVSHADKVGGELLKSVDEYRVFRGLPMVSLVKGVDDKDVGPPMPKTKGERWITVHPHGDEEKGYPVKITENHDGSWSVTGGAGGSLNGLRLTSVKSPEEYKQIARKRQEEKTEKQDKEKGAAWQGLVDKHREDLKAKGFDGTDEELEVNAGQNASREWGDAEAAKGKAVEQVKDAKLEAEQERIARVAEAQGWKPEDYEFSQAAENSVRNKAAQEVMKKPGIQKLLQGDADDVIKAQEKIAAHAEKITERVKTIHHKKLLKVADTVVKNAKELLLAAHDNVSAEAMGDVATGDLVKQTLGDAGKGYMAAIEREAAERGMDAVDAKKQAEGTTWQSMIERKDGDLEKAGKAASFVAKLQEGAAKARKEIKDAQAALGEKGEHLAKIANLDLTPQAEDTSQLAKLVAGDRQLKSAVDAANKELKRADETVPLETLPNAAVVQTKAISDDDAMQRVLADLERTPGERERQRAMGGLVDLYNAQAEMSPLRSHVLAGHSSFFNNVAAVAGVRGPDPFMADILGEDVTAKLMRRAIENRMGDDKGGLDGLKSALDKHHIEKQVEIADTAVEHANELFAAAENIEDAPIDSIESMMAGMDKLEQKTSMLREGREHLGVAMGRLQAGAALNKAFMGAAGHEEQVALGAISMKAAVARAHALGLTEPDQYSQIDGQLLQEGQYHIHNDGKNKFLLIHRDGLDHLAAQLIESPEHLERAQKAAAIKRGDMDEANWLPAGFADRPAVDVSGADGLPLHDTSAPLTLGGDDRPGDIAQKLRDHIGERMAKGALPSDIRRDIQAEEFLQDNAGAVDREKYFQAIRTILPPLEAKADGKAPTAAERLANESKLDDLMRVYMGDHINGKIARGELDSDSAAIHRQTLNADWDTKDKAVQVVLQDPRLQHAFKSVGELDRPERAAVRSYALEKVLLGSDGKPIANQETPIDPLPDAQQHAWEVWQSLGGEKGGDVYKAIQSHMAGHLEASKPAAGGLGSMFGDELPETDDPKSQLASVELGDPTAVLAAAKANAETLGYAPRSVINEDGSHTLTYPDLDAGGDRTESAVASEARKRIQGFLRNHAYANMPQFSRAVTAGESARALASDKLVRPQATFDPASVATSAGDRWGQYVADVGGEERAYQSIMEKMKGDFVGRFAKGMQGTATPIQTQPVPLTHAEAHSLAQLDYDARKRYESQRRGESDRFRARERGRYAKQDYSTREAMEAAKTSNEQLSLTSADAGKTDDVQLDQHRLSMGEAAENTLARMMPKIGLKKGTVAASNIDMSSATGVKRQRAIKLLTETGRVALTLGVGTGKTAISLGAFSELRSKNKVNRAVFGVPSVVQEQFGSEAARFYDLAKGDAPNWMADATLSPDKRRASYADPNVHINVVTHQALRDDLQWAVAQHKFGGDVAQAQQFMESAPESERNATMKEAVAKQGWNWQMTAVDEGHNLLNRRGKANSSMANTLDALTVHSPYHASMSADPVKNDATEGFDVLRKIAPQRYVDDELARESRPMNRHEFSSPAYHVKNKIGDEAYNDAMQNNGGAGLDEHLNEAHAKIAQHFAQTLDNAPDGYAFDGKQYTKRTENGRAVIDGPEDFGKGVPTDEIYHRMVDYNTKRFADKENFAKAVVHGNVGKELHREHKRQFSKTPGVVTRSEFYRRYATNTPATMEALQREMAPYQYAEAVTPDVKVHSSFHNVDLTPEQNHAFNNVHALYRRAREARKRGSVDIEAVKELSPNSFKDRPAAEHEAQARRLQESLGMLRDSALDRVVNQHPDGAKMRWLDNRLKEKPPGAHPKIIFAHNLATVDALKAHLEAQGHRVGTLDGRMNGSEKDSAKMKFSPQFDKQSGKYVVEPEHDILISSDAGAVGWNGQRATHVIHYDTPHTAMVHEQRTGRSVRTGQDKDVTVDTVTTNTNYERKRKARLERKGALRTALTNPAELIDDSGLASRFAGEADAARQRLLTAHSKNLNRVTAMDRGDVVNPPKQPVTDPEHVSSLLENNVFHPGSKHLESQRRRMVPAGDPAAAHYEHEIESENPDEYTRKLSDHLNSIPGGKVHPVEMDGEPDTRGVQFHQPNETGDAYTVHNIVVNKRAGAGDDESEN